MRKFELIDAINAIEKQLFSREVEEALMTEKNFVLIRTEIRLLRKRLENAELSAIADQLEMLAPGLKEGIEEVKAEIRKLEDAQKTLSSIGDVLGLAARLAVLAA
jgi:hypothetical protein